MDVREQIEMLDKAYRAGTPLVSDEVYNALVRYAERTEKSGDVSHVFIPTPGPDTTEVPHVTPMLSIKPTYSMETAISKLRRAFKSHPHLSGVVLVQPKLDGVAIELRYETTLQQIITRFDKVKGLSHHALRNAMADGKLSVNGIPDEVPSDVDVRVRGEMLALPKLASTPLDNSCRSAVAGVVARTDWEKRAELEYHLHFVAYDIWVNGIMQENLTSTCLMFGFTPVHTVCTTMGELEQTILSMPKSTFLSDGTVIKLANPKDRELVGDNGSAVRWAIALKPEPQGEATEVTDITWEVSRKGRLCPTLHFNQIAISSVKYDRCTLHNLNTFRQYELAPGDVVNIVRNGDVIPGLKQVLVRGNKPRFAEPVTCHACGTELTVRVSKTKIPDLICQNYACSERSAARLLHFFGPDGVNLKCGFGPITASAMVRALKIESLADIYRVTPLTYQTQFGNNMGDAIHIALREYASKALSHEIPLLALLRATSYPGSHTWHRKNFVEFVENFSAMAFDDYVELMQDETVDLETAADYIEDLLELRTEMGNFLNFTYILDPK